MKTLLELIPVAAWAALWAAGGWLLVRALFRLRSGEVELVGLATGLILEIWLSNLLAHALSIAVASWLAALLLCAAGGAAAVMSRERLRWYSTWQQWFLLGSLFLIFTLIGRGLGIFDDYQNLPTVSLMATGDVPPHFALNPALNFGYHYFLLLFAAQLMRLGGIFPWTALDVARGLMMALPLMLAGLWAFRVTRSQLAAALTTAMLAFAGGARWLLLLFPQSWLQRISDNITLIGSASTSASSLGPAMLGNWKIDGAGPIPFPFAFYTGINQPFVMAYTGISGSGILILLVLLLIVGRARRWTAALITGGLIAALAIANEIALLLLVLGFGIVIAVWLAQHRSWRLPRELVWWIAVLAVSGVIALLQGGLLTEIVRSRLFPAGGQVGYFDTSLSFVWPPAIVSAHLGSLSLVNPWQLIPGLLEIGPIVLVTPLIIVWAQKSYRRGNWYECALIAASAGMLVAVFVQFKGPLFTATPRLMSGWFFVCILYAVPLLWVWARKRGGQLQSVLALGGLVTCFAGLLLFGIQLLAIQRPVLATFITPLDAKMSQNYWNRLRPGGLIFDPEQFRAPTVFGRFTVSSPTWYTTDPQWQALKAAPSPHALRSAGFDYVYINKDYWDGLTPAMQSSFSIPCVKQIAEVVGIHSLQDYSKDYRRLLDIRTCQ
ncbi:MAG TPA: hypothetical protein VF784_11765 [Anaerolineales bacterium]